MTRWLLLVHIITHKLLDQVFECCWRGFLRMLGTFLYRSNLFALLRQWFTEYTLLYCCLDLFCKQIWELMHLQDKMLYLLSRKLEKVQRTYRACVVLGSTVLKVCLPNCGSTLLKACSPNTSVRTIVLLISPFTVPLCIFLTNFNGGSWVTKHRKNSKPMSQLQYLWTNFLSLIFVNLHCLFKVCMATFGG